MVGFIAQDMRVIYPILPGAITYLLPLRRPNTSIRVAPEKSRIMVENRNPGVLRQQD